MNVFYSDSKIGNVAISSYLRVIRHYYFTYMGSVYSRDFILIFIFPVFSVKDYWTKEIFLCLKVETPGREVCLHSKLGLVGLSKSAGSHFQSGPLWPYFTEFHPGRREDGEKWRGLRFRSEAPVLRKPTWGWGRLAGMWNGPCSRCSLISIVN